jgi:hypothetical protein
LPIKLFTSVETICGYTTPSGVGARPGIPDRVSRVERWGEHRPPPVLLLTGKPLTTWTARLTSPAGPWLRCPSATSRSSPSRGRHRLGCGEGEAACAEAGELRVSRADRRDGCAHAMRRSVSSGIAWPRARHGVQNVERCWNVQERALTVWPRRFNSARDAHARPHGWEPERARAATHARGSRRHGHPAVPVPARAPYSTARAWPGSASCVQAWPGYGHEPCAGILGAMDHPSISVSSGAHTFTFRCSNSTRTSWCV